jgi:hypothetical protein
MSLTSILSIEVTRQESPVKLKYGDTQNTEMCNFQHKYIQQETLAFHESQLTENLNRMAEPTLQLVNRVNHSFVHITTKQLILQIIRKRHLIQVQNEFNKRNRSPCRFFE